VDVARHYQIKYNAFGICQRTHRSEHLYFFKQGWKIVKPFAEQRLTPEQRMNRNTKSWFPKKIIILVITCGRRKAVFLLYAT
jgi:hypothetical protein